MFDEPITENDYKTIADSMQDSKNIRKKANLNMDEQNTCLISHTLYEIQKMVTKEERYPSISEMLDIAARIKNVLNYHHLIKH